MYKQEFALLTPAQRVQRVQRHAGNPSWPAGRITSTISTKSPFEGQYAGRELDFVCKMAVAQRLAARARPAAQYAGRKGRNAVRGRDDAARRSRCARPISKTAKRASPGWEDAEAEAYLMVRLGFAAPDKGIYHLLVDEAQDYSETGAGAAGRAVIPRRKITLLGDPHAAHAVRAWPTAHPEKWGACLGEPDAPLFRLSRCYRSTRPIAELCNRHSAQGQKSWSPSAATETRPSSPITPSRCCAKSLERFRAAGYSLHRHPHPHASLRPTPSCPDSKTSTASTAARTT